MNTQITQNTKDLQVDAQFPQTTREDEIDLRELFSVIWQGKWLIIAITALFAIGSVIFAINQPNIYKAEALLAPASSEASSGGLAALASQFGGLASMAGINLGGKGGIDKTQLAIEVLKSRQFVGEFIEKHQIMPELMAVDKWYISDNRLSFEPELFDTETKSWVREVKAPLKPEPSVQEAHKEFMKIFSVSADKESGMVTIEVEHQSPFIAKQWVDWLILDINRVMKERDVAEAMRSTEFLNKQIELTNVSDIRVILYKLIEEQAKTTMFAEVRDEYVFKTIDPAVVPEDKFKPRRALICILGTFLGFMLSMAIVFTRVALGNRKIY
ncbi:Wzz/FepE/Etk N-terminal domain-containing protein [Shewanella litorisediminis]|uniref:LPS O-antigen length regulator n=1 Tax=Shewanella litorisediminis TaxID=1173586 RepID=A0ABX7FZP1_9GAMM|nr:Wzz/FepE/Etk N-terminal domain-containing protein [Shewanella litorisediminis]MCL2919645.1 Wzz/FepE/Etk N-terminal domain-containing protein [Shewanella litorisediminis]QRH00535.1 LPS O-antigen length regulator [Shewanella litorisediminis]